MVTASLNFYKIPSAKDQSTFSQARQEHCNDCFQVDFHNHNSVLIKISNFVICFCSFYLLCAIFKKDNVIEHLHYLILLNGFLCLFQYNYSLNTSSLESIIICYSLLIIGPLICVIILIY